MRVLRRRARGWREVWAQGTVRKSLDDPAAEIRGAAVAALQVIPDATVAEQLVKLVGTEKDLKTKRNILRALAAAKAPAAGTLVGG